MANSKYTHTCAYLTALFPGMSGWAITRKVKPIWIFMKQEAVSGSGISWAICKSAPHSRQITMPATHHSVFTGPTPFLSLNQQHHKALKGCLAESNSSLPLGLWLTLPAGWLPRTRTTRVSWYQKGNQSGVHWSKREWVAVASGATFEMSLT